jgi:hypothetical protein
VNLNLANIMQDETETVGEERLTTISTPMSGTGLPTTGYEGPGGELDARWGGVVNATSRPLYPR